jgi:hypothetical protein
MPEGWDWFHGQIGQLLAPQTPTEESTGHRALGCRRNRQPGCRAPECKNAHRTPCVGSFVPGFPARRSCSQLAASPSPRRIRRPRALRAAGRIQHRWCRRFCAGRDARRAPLPHCSPCPPRRTPQPDPIAQDRLPRRGRARGEPRLPAGPPVQRRGTARSCRESASLLTTEILCPGGWAYSASWSLIR